MNKFTEELVDLVDKNDCVIGTEWKSNVYKKNLSNFRVINAFIKNSEGKLWIPRRSEHKKLFPLCLDVSIGGHVKSGESYFLALLRESEEEIQLSLKKSDVKLLYILTPHRDGVSGFMKVYEIFKNTCPNYNRDEFCEWFWFWPNEIIEKIKNGDKAKPDLPILINKCYL